MTRGSAGLILPVFTDSNSDLLKVLRHSTSPEQWQRLISASGNCLVGKALDQCEVCLSVRTG